MATVSDRKTGVDDNGDGTVDHYKAEVLTAQDYYAFGMTMPGRNYSAGKYRYGFNGKENDKEVGEGIQDYGMRISDNRLGRFFSIDPLTRSYPWYTPYQFAGNTPIQAIDLDGLEEWVVTRWYDKDQNVAKIAAVVGVRVQLMRVGITNDRNEQLGS